MKVILFDLDGTIQDSEKIGTDANRYGFRMVLDRDPTNTELEQLIGKPVPKIAAKRYPDKVEVDWASDKRIPPNINFIRSRSYWQHNSGNQNLSRADTIIRSIKDIRVGELF